MILLVEDDPVTAHILTALLTRLRHPHALATTAGEALARLARQPVDLVIVDLGLPDMDGFELIERIAARPHLRDVPVMVCTADSSAASVERALGLGVVDYVKQPITVDGFAARVQRALHQAPARWERWSDVVRRLRVDQRVYEQLLALLHDELRGLCAQLGAIGAIGADRVPVEDTPTGELAAAVARARGAALNVGAVRVVQLIDALWSDRAHGRDLAAGCEDLREALAIELGAVEQVMHPAARRSGGLGLAAGRGVEPGAARVA